MVGNMVGMDVEGVRQLANQMQTRADEIQQIATQLTQALDGAQWIGADREAFVADWKSRHMGAMTSVADALRQASSTAMQNAQQQEDASR